MVREHVIEAESIVRQAMEKTFYSVAMLVVKQLSLMFDKSKLVDGCKTASDLTKLEKHKNKRYRAYRLTAKALGYTLRAPLPFTAEIIIKALFPGDGAIEDWTGFKPATISFWERKLLQSKDEKQLSTATD